MASKIILDANILLDFILKRSADYTVLEKIYSEIVEGNLKNHITTSIIHTCGYWLTKAIGSNHAKHVILTMLNDTMVIDASQSTVVDALHSNMVDIEDSLQYYTALEHKLDFFISRDVKFIKSAKPGLPIYSPADFAKKFID